MVFISILCCMSDYHSAFEKEKALETLSKGFQHFLIRTGKKVTDIATDFKLTKAAVSSWKKGVSFPDFPKIFKLLEMGMTINEMFGDEIAKTEKMNQLMVETEEIKKHLLLWKKSSFSVTASDIQNKQSAEIEESLNKTVTENEKKNSPFENGIRLIKEIRVAIGGK